MEVSSIGTLGLYLILAFVMPGFCYMLVFTLFFPDVVENGTDWLKAREVSPKLSIPGFAIVGGLLFSSVCFAIEILVRCLSPAYMDKYFRLPGVDRIACVEAAGKGTLYLQLLTGSALMHFNIGLGVFLISATYLGWCLLSWMQEKTKKSLGPQTPERRPRRVALAVLLIVSLPSANLVVSGLLFARAKSAIDEAVRVAVPDGACHDPSAVPCSSFGAASEPCATPTYENLSAVLWVQSSVEYKASSVETYRAAEVALQEGLQNRHWTAALEQTGNFEALPPAVILDLDETVLDNSAFQARMVVSGQSYALQAWEQWVSEEKAGLIPGAMDFLQFARSHGVTPLYITNRKCDPSNSKDPTVKLLRRLQLPSEPVAQRLLCQQREDDTDKKARRAQCAAKYRILLLVGDQLEDFLEVPPELANPGGREKLFVAHQSLWGKRWFQLSNPMYGSWERAIDHSVAKKLTKLRQ